MVRTVSCAAACCLLLTVMLVLPASGYPSPGYYRREGSYDPSEIMGMINRLGNLIEMERKMDTYYKDDITSEKRALDLGLSRGYSGALQAKHLMGIAAANYAGGPGRRRRDTSQ